MIALKQLKKGKPGGKTAWRTGGSAPGRQVGKEYRMATAGGTEGARGGEAPTVLVIDDDADVRRLLQRALERNCRVLCAENVDVAMEMLQLKYPRLIIIDFDMPGKNGIEGAREIKQFRPHISIVMLTGSATREIMQEAMKAGVHECLSKPLDTHVLMETVERYLKQNHTAR